MMERRKWVVLPFDAVPDAGRRYANRPVRGRSPGGFGASRHSRGVGGKFPGGPGSSLEWPRNPRGRVSWPFRAVIRITDTGWPAPAPAATVPWAQPVTTRRTDRKGRPP
ncbi:hypothetical protein GCM10018790_36010 [Kitasatospora xanthocidica]|nr:hypothetical protein GCM10018790_36010 [Kitasatospora xanthocidica]